MFCPVGYTTVAELWTRYREERIVSFYQSATSHYHSPDFSSAFVRGSPLDICEHVFLKSLTMVGVNVACTDGRLFKLYSPLEDGHNGLFSVLNIPSSADNAAVSAVENGNEDVVRRIAGYRYKSWDDDSIRDDWWREKYPKLTTPEGVTPRDIYERLWYHCLPICFERNAFTIVKKLPVWAVYFGHAGDTERIVGRFAGWSICVANEAVEEWLPYLNGKEVCPNTKLENDVSGRVGRPSKVEDALVDFKSVFPNGRTMSMKRTLTRIEEVTGRRYSDSTLRRALDTQSE